VKKYNSNSCYAPKTIESGITTFFRHYYFQYSKIAEPRHEAVVILDLPHILSLWKY
jgi:hypothetical protein